MPEPMPSVPRGVEVPIPTVPDVEMVVVAVAPTDKAARNDWAAVQVFAVVVDTAYALNWERDVFTFVLKVSSVSDEAVDRTVTAPSLTPTLIERSETITDRTTETRIVIIWFFMVCLCLLMG